MNFENFTKASNELEIPNNIPVPKEPDDRALVIGYIHADMEEHIKAYEDRYKEEGYNTKTLFLSADDVRIIVNNKLEIGDNPKSQELKEAIAWVKDGENSLVSFNHHGSEGEMPKIFQGKTTAKILGKHGLSGDLNKMDIRYEPCFGAQKEAWPFFSILKNNGASNFLGDAKTVENATVVDGGEIWTPEEKTENEQKIISEIDEINKSIDVLKVGSASVAKDIMIEGLEQHKEELNKNLEIEEEKVGRIRVQLKRGDSSVEFKNKDGKKIKDLPRAKDENNKFKYNRYYLCEKAKPNEKPKLTWTTSPKVVEKFKNMDIRFGKDKKKLDEAIPLKKPRRKSGVSMG